ncbi:MAG: PEP-CTERM sorting domain-containing protein [Phycisphaeraceae bacterium]|nr:PEP-CTERM sorting domain-containing protein [Phycisphaeraceae bacterium]
MKSKQLQTLMSLLVLAMAGTSQATLNDDQGFEVDTGDWIASSTITRVASGAGTLAVTSATGSYHAELTNLHDGYGYQYFGDGGFSRFGGRDPVYHGDFYQAIDVYIDTAWAQPTPYPSLEAFWIDMSPANTSDTSEYGAEHNFRFRIPGNGTVVVTPDGDLTPVATITSSGWYTFEMTFRKTGPLATDLIATDMSIYDASQALIGSVTKSATSPGGPSPSSVLGGNSYVWISVWQNEFAGDVLAIDNVRTGLIPEPASLLLLGLSGLMLVTRRNHQHI